MRKKHAVSLVAVVGGLSLLVPISASASGSPAAKGQPLCFKHQGPGQLNLQIGYCPKG